MRYLIYAYLSFLFLLGLVVLTESLGRPDTVDEQSGLSAPAQTNPPQNEVTDSLAALHEKVSRIPSDSLNTNSPEIPAFN